jgi:16S rRNA (guanine527-N7)-methyltransferase
LERPELDILVSSLASHQLRPDSSQVELFWRYGELLLEWNQRVNLISRKDESGALSKHILHSLTIAFFHSFSPKERVLDLGTGGGLPAIPLAILFPETYFLLIDSIGKKITACSDMIKRLGLKNALAQKSRADELKNVQFDTIVSRQVAPMLELCQWSRPLLKKGGELLCLKGGDLEEEIGQALVDGAARLSFPEKIEQHPLDFLGEKFAGKVVVAAR